MADNSRARPQKRAQIELHRSASAASFRAIYDKYFDFAWASARRLGVPSEAIDDVVQDIFVVVNDRLDTLEHAESLRSWIYGVVRRTVSTYHRRRNARDARESSEAARDIAGRMQPSPLDLAILSDELKLLWELLNTLDDRKREILVLVELEEMTVPEVADAVGIPLNTAYSRLRAARQEFNDAFLRHLSAPTRSR